LSGESSPAPARESAPEVLAAWLADALRRLRGHRKLVERALVQVRDEDFFRALDPESNSIAVIVQHATGNMRSRFTDFLTTDGEKPDRLRDGEFRLGGESREQLMRAWEEGWETTLASLDAITWQDLSRSITISGEPHSVAAAITRHLAHFAYHAGQIVYLAKHWAGSGWKTVSIPRDGSAAYSERVRKKFEGRG
jgi:hypothetical protein